MFNRFKEDTTQLTDLENLIKEKVTGRVIKHEVQPLTSFGENFGSEILRVDITLEENGREKILHAVAKLIPPTEMQLEIFNTQVTFKNEMEFLAVIAPLLQDFQREHRFPEIARYFPQVYGARYTLKHNSDVVDNDAVILMENLKKEGFGNIDRMQGFDLDTTKHILKVLANFQATVVGVKFKRPDIFKSKIRPYLTEFYMPPMGDEKKDPLFTHMEPYLKENPNTALLVGRIKKFLTKMKNKKVKKIREPWATIVHNDLWVNNIMVKHTNQGNTEIKLVDFQVIDYGSPITDLIFFLFSSVQAPVLRYHFDKLVLYYYNEFIKTLQQLNVETKEFSYESFQEELKLEVGLQMQHSLLMMGVVFGPKGMPKMPGKVPEWNPNRHSSGVTNGSSSFSHAGPPKAGKGNEHAEGPPMVPWPLECKEKCWFIFEEAAKRNWI